MTSLKSTSTEKKEPQSEQGPKQKKTKKAAKELLNDPVKIVQAVLDKSRFKVPNLSQIVEEKFYQASDYNRTLNVKYESTVGPDVEISILPHGFDGRINLPVMAITELPCIHKKANKTRWRKRRNNVKSNAKDRVKDIDKVKDKDESGADKS